MGVIVSPGIHPSPLAPRRHLPSTARPRRLLPGLVGVAPQSKPGTAWVLAVLFGVPYPVVLCRMAGSALVSRPTALNNPGSEAGRCEPGDAVDCLAPWFIIPIKPLDRVRPRVDGGHNVVQVPDPISGAELNRPLTWKGLPHRVLPPHRSRRVLPGTAYGSAGEIDPTALPARGAVLPLYRGILPTRQVPCMQISWCTAAQGTGCAWDSP